MKRLFFLLLVATSFLCSCAGTYHTSNPGSYNYKTEIVNAEDKITYSYIFDIFKKREYHKYERKETHKKVNMVAVKITNNSELPIIINSGHFSVASSGQQVKLYSPNEFYNIIKQEKGYYFFWLIGNPTYFNTTPGTITGYNPTTGTLYGTPPVTHYYPIPIGTALAFLNFFTAKAANKRLLADLKQNQLMGKTLEPGGSAYGYIYIDQPPTQFITISLD